MKIVRRTFEAKKYPKESAKRIELNCDWLTSEYMPSYRYGIRADDGSRGGIPIRDVYETKAEAVEALARWEGKS